MFSQTFTQLQLIKLGVDQVQNEQMQVKQHGMVGMQALVAELYKLVRISWNFNPLIA